MQSGVWQSSLDAKYGYQVIRLRRRVFVWGVPEAQTLSDWSMMAPWRIMPSVWPVVVCRAAALVIWTDGAIVLSISRYFRYDELARANRSCCLVLALGSMSVGPRVFR